MGGREHMIKTYLGIAAIVGASLIAGCRTDNGKKLLDNFYQVDVNGDGLDDLVVKSALVVEVQQPDGSYITDYTIKVRIVPDEEWGWSIQVKQPDGSFVCPAWLVKQRAKLGTGKMYHHPDDPSYKEQD